MFGDIGKILKMAKDMKQKMPAMQAELATKEFIAEAGGGMVKATVNGKGQLVGIRIAPEVVRGGDVEMLEDLVKAAVSAAQTKAGEAMADMMREFTGGIELPPGLDELMG